MQHVFINGEVAQKIWRHFGIPLGINTQQSTFSPKSIIVCWKLPTGGNYQLNIDGSFKSANVNVGIGGILRNEEGNMVLGFSVPIQCASNIEAEAMAAKYGINLCIQKNYSRFMLEVDSTVLVQMINDNKSLNYYLNWIMEDIKEKKIQANIKVEHCFREANRVADYLAKNAAGSQNFTLYDSYQQLPVGAKGLFQLDKSQMPSIRIKYDKASFFVS
ncbi:uncharacterized protein LOC132619619 [Lycium barbarum]|uniref:uncharacterized protein LOC132619619 n=1 Tax=Lycium barbarum TaxID=112863 RepID=UPI00293F30DA|nr:uncharacterized protein LOC132619619 [Lycium barbarum]